VSDLPPFGDIAGLPIVFDEVVAADQIDENGHMNIRHYFGLGSWAVWKAIQAAGVDDAYMSDQAKSLFTVEHHIRYFGELRLGERFTVHERILARSSRAVHAMAFVLDREREKVASTLEIVYVHVSLADRVAVDLPDEVAEALDARIEAGRSLGWDAPVCGAMGVRKTHG
jgi:acyl-CoA thioester hydrolase